MFVCATKTLSVILFFTLMFYEIVSSAQIAIPGFEAFSPCKNGILHMTRAISQPPSEKNHWIGYFTDNIFQYPEDVIVIKLKLTAPANVTLLDPQKGKVHFKNGEFVMSFPQTQPAGFLSISTGNFYVRAEQDGVFPNVQSITVNDSNICSNPLQWKTDIPGVTSSEKNTELSNNDSEKETKLDNNDTDLKCGKRLVNHQGLIKGGELTKEGDWPWHAAIFHQERINSYAYKCGGVLLNKNTVLTAAHCVIQTGRFIVPERVLVKLGLHHRFVGGRNVQEFQVFRIIPHEKFNFTYLYNDIAILKLSTEATYTNYVQPVCLWPEADAEINSLIGKPGDVIGWGFYDKLNELSDYLGYGTMPIVSVYTCLESNRPFFGLFVSSQTFCAGYRNGTSVCNGDSGGGMFFERNGAYLLRGLVSVSVSLRNEQVCDPYEYVVFTDVAQYLDWIKRKL